MSNELEPDTTRLEKTRNLCIKFNKQLKDMSDDFLSYYVILYSMTTFLIEGLNGQKKLFIEELKEYKDHPKFKEIFDLLSAVKYLEMEKHKK